MRIALVRRIAATFLAALPLAGTASTYFVDADIGDDRLSGTAQAASGAQGPWRSLARIGTVELGEQDRVLLRCGQTWREELRVRSSVRQGSKLPLVAGYGSNCARFPPTLTGARPLPDLRLFNGALVSDVPDAVSSVFDGSERLARARFPASGPYVLEKGEGTTGADNKGRILLPKLATKRSLSDLVGAELWARNRDWRTELRVVASATSDAVLLDKPFFYDFEPGYGAVFYGLPWMLGEGEGWAWDRRSSQLKIRKSYTAEVAAKRLSMTLRRTLVEIDGGVELRGLRLAFPGLDGVLARIGPIRIIGLEVRDAARDAVVFEGVANGEIRDSVIERSGRDSVVMRKSRSIEMVGNTIARSGTTFEFGEAFAAVNSAESESVHVRGNLIRESGYAAVRIAKSSSVEENVIEESCLKLDDCGAIYVWNRLDSDKPVNTVIVRNLILGVRSNPVGRPAKRDVGVGVYLDSGSNGVSVTENLVADTWQGVMLMDSFGNSVSDNVFFQAKDCLICADISHSHERSALSQTNEVVGNRLYGDGIVVATINRFGLIDLPRLRGNVASLSDESKLFAASRPQAFGMVPILGAAGTKQAEAPGLVRDGVRVVKANAMARSAPRGDGGSTAGVWSLARGAWVVYANTSSQTRALPCAAGGTCGELEYSSSKSGAASELAPRQWKVFRSN